jgi:hypothetical protein
MLILVSKGGKARIKLWAGLNLLLQHHVAALAAKLHQVQDANGFAAVVAGSPNLGSAAFGLALLSECLTVLKRQKI